MYTAVKKEVQLDMNTAKLFTIQRTMFREGRAYPILGKVVLLVGMLKEYMAVRGYRLTTEMCFITGIN